VETCNITVTKSVLCNYQSRPCCISHLCMITGAKDQKCKVTMQHQLVCL
jgi:hypothetical protein